MRGIETHVRAAASGDREAFARLITETEGLVRSISLAIVGNVERSEDVAQEVYLAAWRGLRSLQTPEKFLPWLRRIARNRAHSSRGMRDAPLDDAAAVGDGRPPALESLIAAEDAQRIEAALQRLPVPSREALVLFYREDCSIGEAAAKLGVSEAVFRKRLSRARERLRAEVLEPAEESLGRKLPALAPLVLGRLPVGPPPAAPLAASGATPAVIAALSAAAAIVAVAVVVAVQPAAPGGAAPEPATIAAGERARSPHHAPAAQQDSAEGARSRGGAVPPEIAGAMLEAIVEPPSEPEDEAKTHLSGVFSAQRAYLREHGRYSEDLVALDWYPGVESPRYVFGFCGGGDRSHTMRPEVAGAPDEPVSMTGTLDLADPCAALRAAGVDPAQFAATATSFRAFAIGNLDDDADLDVWSISSERMLDHLRRDRPR